MSRVSLSKSANTVQEKLLHWMKMKWKGLELTAWFRLRERRMWRAGEGVCMIFGWLHALYVQECRGVSVS